VHAKGPPHLRGGEGDAVRATNSAVQPAHAARTVLEARIRSRRITLEEFVKYADDFTRKGHGGQARWLPVKAGYEEGRLEA